MIKYWLGVASKDHIEIGVAEGFCQLNHGKRAPLARMKKADHILYYAPKESLKSQIPCQQIIAAGTILDDTIYAVKVSPDFIPYRRNVDYDTQLVPLSLAKLRLIASWEIYRSKLRFGHFEISQELYDTIYQQMKSE